MPCGSEEFFGMGRHPSGAKAKDQHTGSQDPTVGRLSQGMQDEENSGKGYCTRNPRALQLGTERSNLPGGDVLIALTLSQY